ncbi:MULTISPECIES: GntP family permease [Prauserella salsuginis group]|uniref:GntP family permease n=1 Tax=Prauserella salsuginis TaxID=387889 RepID=A0ABW6FY63_9PSEU|nr:MULTISPECIES: GntP family permease [Prauserella salsuginis group]MCR3720209.1 gluconate:H+ symporter, GntP family [Prauserella flava]MCR3734082.1 gluconate:H+ symporter, GntP family [Prauserella salsuginis]
MEEITPAYGVGPLLAIAAGAVALLLLLIIKFRVHALIALVLISVLTAVATRIPLDELVDTLMGGFGTTLAEVGLLVGLGAMIGRLLEVTGGADVLANSLVNRFGAKRAPLALGVAALFFGFPIFLDAAFVVFVPIIFSVATRFGGSVLFYALPPLGAFAVMHAFVPPHPGPVSAAEFLDADMGLVLLVGLVIAVPTWYLAGYVGGKMIGRRVDLAVPALSLAGTSGTNHGTGDSADGDTAGGDTATGDLPYPRFRTVIGILLLPMVLIFLDTGLNTLGTAGVVDADATWVQALRVLGATPIALLVTALVSLVVLGRGRSRASVENIVNGALAPVCAIILITGAGGMFGEVLYVSGIGQALAETLKDLGIPLILAAFLISTGLRVAQGSATVALTTTAGLIAPTLAATEGVTPLYRALLVITLACGATVLSHVNDSGFWLVGRYLGMDVKTTLKTWTVLETLIGVIGFGLVLVLSIFA